LEKGQLVGECFRASERGGKKKGHRKRARGGIIKGERVSKGGAKGIWGVVGGGEGTFKPLQLSASLRYGDESLDFSR